MAVTRQAAEALFREMVEQEIITKAPQTSVAMATIPTVQMPDKSQRYPLLASLPTAKWLNAEGDQKPLTDVTWDKTILTAEEIAAIVPIDESVIEDANEDVVARVTSLLIEQFAQAVDKAVFFGDFGGADLPTFPTGGLLGAALGAKGAGKVTRTDTIANDLNDVFSAVENLGTEVSHVFADLSIKNALRAQTGSGGFPLYIPTDTAANVDSIYGRTTRYPLGWDKSKAVAIALDTRCAMIGIRRDVEVKILDQATLQGFGNLAEQDAIAIRARMRVGFQIANPIYVRNEDRKYPIAALVPKPAAAAKG